MNPKLVILDGFEKGIEIAIEPNTIYSIGTGNDSDFYVRKSLGDFSVFLRIIESGVELWTNKKSEIQIDDSSLTLSLNKQVIQFNSILQIAGRSFGVFTNKSDIEKASEKFIEDESTDNTAIFFPNVEADNIPTVHPSDYNEFDIESSELKQSTSENSTGNAESSKTEALNIEVGSLNKSSAQLIEETNNARDSDLTIKSSLTNKSNAKNDELLDSSENIEKTLDNKSLNKKSTIHQYLKIAPFVLGMLILIGYGMGSYQKTKRTFIEQKSLNSEEESQKKQAANDKDTLTNDDLAFDFEVDLNQENSTDNQVSQDVKENAPEFVASGLEYNKNKTNWVAINETEVTETQAINSLRQKLNEGTIDSKIAQEQLFPDEKMMGLIKDMLDTAGAEGIDVRFDRGNYDVYGFVMDDEKWQRIFKILTFDLDLTKVRFSVETSISLLNKFETLLKKFNLSDFVVLSLGANGEILAKTYYPPALEGLWFTIKDKFENKFGEYTSIKEYRAHIGWVDVVKISFDQPSYILLGDGRRLVEGSVWGGSSVLEKIYNDSIKITAGPSQTRYYVINKSKSLVSENLSDS